MKRSILLKKAFQRGHLLTLKNKVYREWIEKFIIDETKGDIGEGDITSNAVIKQNKVVKALVKSREKGIVAGLEEAIFLYKKNKIRVVQVKKDGQKIKKGDILLKLEGKEKDLLKIERSAIDIIQRMSGIATLTKDFVEKTKGKVQIAPTRKTQWRYLDKKAAFVGGSLTHRLALWESILIKDNHIAALRREGVTEIVETSIRRAWGKRKRAVFIEIEVTTQSDAVKAAKMFKTLKRSSTFPCLIMLDNMSPSTIKKTIAKLKEKDLYSHVLMEVSGGITPKNITKFLIGGVDVISVGYLTHSSRALNIKQSIV